MPFSHLCPGAAETLWTPAGPLPAPTGTPAHGGRRERGGQQRLPAPGTGVRPGVPWRRAGQPGAPTPVPAVLPGGGGLCPLPGALPPGLYYTQETRCT